LAVPNVEESHIYRGGGKNFSLVQSSLISPLVNDVIKRHWSYWNQQKKQNNYLMPLGTGYVWCPLWAIMADYPEKSRETSLPYCSTAFSL